MWSCFSDVFGLPYRLASLLIYIIYIIYLNNYYSMKSISDSFGAIFVINSKLPFKLYALVNDIRAVFNERANIFTHTAILLPIINLCIFLSNFQEPSFR